MKKWQISPWLMVFTIMTMWRYGISADSIIKSQSAIGWALPGIILIDKCKEYLTGRSHFI